MPIVFKPVALQPPGRQRQHWIQPVQGLDGGLFVHAKHRRMLRRFDVQSDNIGRLSLKVGVVGGHVAFDPMRLKPGALPHPRHHHVANAQVAGQLAAAPVAGAIGRRSAGPFQNFSLQRRGSFLHRASAIVRIPARQPLGFETTLPATDVVGVAAQRLANRRVGFALRQQQDQPCTAYILGW